jgi:hypothetical protein
VQLFVAHSHLHFFYFCVPYCYADVLEKTKPSTAIFDANWEKVDETTVKKCWIELWKHLATQTDKAIVDGIALLSAAGRRAVVEKKPKQVFLEDYTQELMTCVHTFCLAYVKSKHVLRDTHAVHAPLQPNHKMDHILVAAGTSSAASTSRVSWLQILYTEELKHDFSTALYEEVRLQLVDNLLEILNKQPDRKFVYGQAGCGTNIEFFRTDTNDSFSSSGSLDFLLPNVDTATDGFSLYLRMLKTSAEMLGYTPFQDNLPESVFDTIGVRRADCVSTLQRRGPEGKPHVFSVVSTATDITYCVKLHQSQAVYDKEKSVYDLRINGGTTLVGAGELFLVVQPYASASFHDFEFKTDAFDSACHTAASVLTAMHSSNIGYCDASPANVLVQEQGDGSSVCYWNDYSHIVTLGSSLHHFQGTLAYASASMCSLQLGMGPFEYSRLDDLEAIFYVLLSYAWTDDHKKRQLPWCQMKVSGDMIAQRLTLMNKFTEDILPNVQESVRDTINALHHEVFVNTDCKATLALLAGVSSSSRSSSSSSSRSSSSSSSSSDIEVVFGSRNLFHHAEHEHGNTRLSQMKLSTALEGQLVACTSCFNKEQIARFKLTIDNI